MTKTIPGSLFSLFTCLCLMIFVGTVDVHAAEYSIEVLQVSNIPPFDNTYEGFVEALAEGGIIAGENLTINRTIIEADPQAGLWKKIFILRRIKKESSRIIKRSPDLVLTIGTPATKYSKDKIISAGIPLVFSSVANPMLIGCRSMDTPMTGLTGATLYQDPIVLLSLAQAAIPKIKKVAIVHSDDDNAISFAEEAARKAPNLGIEVLTSQVDKSDSIKPSVEELIAKGADSFAVPLDVYYALRDSEPAKDIFSICMPKGIPVFSFANHNQRGAILYAGADFGVIGGYSGKIASTILKQSIAPETLPIMKQIDIDIYVDLEIAKNLGIEIHPSILEIAKERF